MRPFQPQNPNIITSLPLVPLPQQQQLFFKNKPQQQQQQQQQQLPVKYPKRVLNQPISNKSNIQYELTLKQKNEITIKINKLSELIIRDEPKVYYHETDVNFAKRDPESIIANLPLIDQKKLNAPIKTRQFLPSSYIETYNEMHGKSASVNTHHNTNNIFNTTTKSKVEDPTTRLLHENHSRFPSLTFNGKLLKISEDGSIVEIMETQEEKLSSYGIPPPSLKKRSILELEATTSGKPNNLLPQIKRKHRYDIPLDNSRTISAKEVLRMVDSSLISSDMDYSQSNSITSTSMILNGPNDTPLKAIPSYLKFFNNGNVLMDTPLKNNSTSTPQLLNRFTNLQDDEFRCSPLNGSKLRKL